MSAIEDLLARLTPTQYKQIKEAVETGKGADGQSLTAEQRANALQVLMLFDVKYHNQDQHLTVNAQGEINQLSRDELKRTLS